MLMNKRWILIRNCSGELVWGNVCQEVSAAVYCCMAETLEEAQRKHQRELASRANQLFDQLKGEPLDELRLHKAELLDLLAQL